MWTSRTQTTGLRQIKLHYLNLTRKITKFFIFCNLYFFPPKRHIIFFRFSTSLVYTHALSNVDLSIMTSCPIHTILYKQSAFRIEVNYYCKCATFSHLRNFCQHKSFSQHKSKLIKFPLFFFSNKTSLQK